MPPLVGQLSELAARNHMHFAALTHASGIMYAALFAEEGREMPSAGAATIELFAIECMTIAYQSVALTVRAK